MPKPKEMEISTQGSYADGRWNFTVQAWLGTKSAVGTLISILEIMRSELPDALPDPPGAPSEASAPDAAMSQTNRREK